MKKSGNKETITIIDLPLSREDIEASIVHIMLRMLYAYSLIKHLPEHRDILGNFFSREISVNEAMGNVFFSNILNAILENDEHLWRLGNKNSSNNDYIGCYQACEIIVELIEGRGGLDKCFPQYNSKQDFDLWVEGLNFPVVKNMVKKVQEAYCRNINIDIESIIRNYDEYLEFLEKRDGYFREKGITLNAQQLSALYEDTLEKYYATHKAILAHEVELKYKKKVVDSINNADPKDVLRMLEKLSEMDG